MARLISSKVTIASTGWETLYATESALPRGTEAFVTGILISNATGSSADVDFAIVESESDTPVAADNINSAAQTVANGAVAKALIPTSTEIDKIAIGRGQTLKAKSTVAGVVVRVFGTQGAEDTLVGLQAAA